MPRAEAGLAPSATWQQWATGNNPSPAALVNATRQLQHTGGYHAQLAQPLATWIEQHDLAPQRPTPNQRHVQPQLQHRPEPPGLDIGF